MSIASSKLTLLETEKRNQLKNSKPLVYDKVMKYDEKLNRGESIAIIQFQYDYACNFHCQHCSVSYFRNKKGDRSFTVADVKELSRQADEMGLAHLDLTGGEPLAFKDLDQVIEAIDPSKFYLQVDTNGWLMTDEKAKHLKRIGVDKVQLSLDNLKSAEHDVFRKRKGSHERALRSIDAIKNAGLNLQVASVVTHQRVHSEEFIEFLEWAKAKDIAVSVVFPKLVGEWEGRYDLAITAEDIDYIHSLRSAYHVYDHLTPKYGQDMGCLAVKGMISITKWGDVMPCIWMYFALGNFFKEPLRDIIQRGLKYFGKHEKKCLVSEDKEFIDNYVAKTYGRDIPVPIEEVMGNRL
jgi:MoaA/NifB/PqqE/SkfB family radical SAM enzyme